MSDSILAYETPGVYRPSGLCTATWIVALVLGIIYCLGGVCVGGAGGVAILAAGSFAGMPRGAFAAIIAVFAGMTLLVLGVGVVYIWASWQMRRGSRAAMITALIVASINAVFLLGLGVAIVAGSASRIHIDSEAIMGGLFYGFGGLVHGALATLTILLLREGRRAV